MNELMSSPEARFIESEDLTHYQGMWIAILDKKIIAKGKTMSEVYDKVKENKIVRTPLYQRIPEKGEIDAFIL